MFRRLLRQVGVFVSALLVAVPGPAMALPSQAPRPPKPGGSSLSATSMAIMMPGQRSPAPPAWSMPRAAGPGARTVLVQIGDVADRGPDSLKIIRQLMKLQREAAGRGGQVIALVGNHEAMNMTGDLRYVHPGEYARVRRPELEGAAGPGLRSEPCRDRNRLSHP